MFMRLLQKAKPNGKQRASSDLAVTKAISYKFESPPRMGKLHSNFYEGLLIAAYAFFIAARE